MSAVSPSSLDDSAGRSRCTAGPILLLEEILAAVLSQQVDGDRPRQQREDHIRVPSPPDRRMTSVSSGSRLVTEAAGLPLPGFQLAMT
jgi:hypothetical protein